MTSNCSSALDCSLSGVVKECYDRNGLRFCDCSVILGWIGDECDETSLDLYYMRICEVVTLIWVVMNILWLLYLILGRLLKVSNTQHIKRLLLLASLYLTSSVFFLISKTLQAIVLWDNKAVSIRTYRFWGKDIVAIGSKHLVLFYQFLILSIVCLILSHLVLILTWFDVIRRVNLVFPQTLSSTELKLAKFVKFVVPIVLLIVSILAFVGQLVAAIGITLILAIVTTCPYRRLVNDIVIPLRKHCNSIPDTEELRRMIDKIIFIHRGFNVILLMGVGFCAIWIVFSLNYPSNFEMGGLTLVIPRDVFYICVFGFISFGTWYIQDTSGKIKTSYSNKNINKITSLS